MVIVRMKMVMIMIMMIVMILRRNCKSGNDSNNDDD